MKAADASEGARGAARRGRLGLAGQRDLAERVRDHVAATLEGFPWPFVLRDWTGRTLRLGAAAPHWDGRPFELTLRAEAAGRALLASDGMRFLEAFLRGEAELEGNLYLLAELRAHANLSLGWLRALPRLLLHRVFQSPARARVNVKSHYDVPQEALDLYLDRVYRAYSCAIFADPALGSRDELLRAGDGEADTFDSLEKAQWRKFRDAADWVAPEAGETLLDIGCGYGGQLRVALDAHPLGRVVGWTHSSNQARGAAELLAGFDPGRFEVREGDYRLDHRVYDHVTSTGMISHVGPRGLAPYVRNVRKRIRTGGRYLHHALMCVSSRVPLDLQLGPYFHKRYVWPGFHWFTVGEHVRALERGGFEVVRLVNLSDHYAKTTAAWYERLMERREAAAAALGDATLRAWRLFLAGSSGDFSRGGIHVYRIYCRAV